MPHQYVERQTGRMVNEPLYGDRIIRFLYNRVRENAPSLFRIFTSSWMSSMLAQVNYDLPFVRMFTSQQRFLQQCGIDLSECLDVPTALDTPRKVFERKIRYWECRPLPDDRQLVVSPADARVAVGSFEESSHIAAKDKFFSYDELLGLNKRDWLQAFEGGDFAVFRLTPDKYHYNHTPVAGTVVDYYEIDGAYHSCNPTAIVAVVTPYSKNRRVVTVIDTDVPGGTGVGLVAMIEVVALMIGQIVQCYSELEYRDPRDIAIGGFLSRGQPKSLYRPGSSTDILIFQKGRIRFDEDLIRNMHRPDAEGRFTRGFRIPLVETDVRVRSQIASRGD